MQRRSSLRWRRGLGSIALALSVLGPGACSDEEEGCLWSVDDLLERGRARVADNRIDCGMVFDGGGPALAEPLDCFLDAPADTGSELLVNHCIDCFSISRYYRTPRAEIIGVHQSSARYTMEAPRRSFVTRCATLVLDQGYIKCSQPEEELYYCAEPESAWELPEPSPAAPPGTAAPSSRPSGVSSADDVIP